MNDLTNDLDENLAQMFARHEPESGGEAFAAAVRARIARERRIARALELCLGTAAGLAAAALVGFAPETVLYPVHAMQRWISSPLGAAAGALAAVGLAWWSRFGEV